MKDYPAIYIRLPAKNNGFSMRAAFAILVPSVVIKCNIAGLLGQGVYSFHGGAHGSSSR